jgi:predicted Zn-dependent protease
MTLHTSKQRKALFETLSGTWFKEGHPVCFLEGSPGIGKTDLAGSLQDHWARQIQKPYAYQEIPDAKSPLLNDSLFEIAGRLNDQGISTLAAAVTSGGDLVNALAKTLEQPVLIVVDEVQRLFHGTTNHPEPDFANLLNVLKNRRAMPGRLLLVSDRMVERARWSEPFEKHRLEKLEPEEATKVLDNLLTGSRRQDEVPVSRRHDLVMALDRNPRALQALVSALEYDSLEAILSQDPGLWATTDRDVSPELLRKLEVELLERTLAGIEPRIRELLQRLSVHRRSVEKGALQRITASEEEFRTFRDSLIQRFLLQHRSGWFTLNPIAREISLAELKKSHAYFRQAHSLAADYHLGPFKARELTGNVLRLSGRFAELRYHLVNAGRVAELRESIFRFADFLKREFTSAQRIPPLGTELDERIAVLAVLLEEPGPKSLEEYLARLLQARGGPGDLHNAAKHAERAKGPRASIQLWLMYARLQADIYGIDRGLVVINEAFRTMPEGDQRFELYHLGSTMLSFANRREEAVSLLRQGLLYVPREKNRFALYQRSSEMLVESNETQTAIDLLQEGIRDIPADNNVAVLYQSCADLMARESRVAEAIDLLKVGIAKVPADKNVVMLYQSCADLLARERRAAEAIDLLKHGIAKVPAGKNVAMLYQSCAELMAREGRTGEAVDLLKDGIAKVPADKAVSTLYYSYAELMVAEGRAGEAIDLLKDGIAKVPADKAVSTLYQSYAELMAREGRAGEAIDLLKDGIAKIPADKAVSTLYYSCAGLMAREGRAGEAIDLLKNGIAKIPVDKGVFVLYQICAELMAQEGRDAEAIDLVKGAISEVRSEHERGVLIHSLAKSTSSNDRERKVVATTPDVMSQSPLATQNPSTNSMKQPRVFVSHASSDKPFVRRLVQDLRNHNNVVWIDEQELKAGDSIVAGISDGLKNTDYMIVVVSQASMDSKWVQAELSAGLMEQLSKGGVTILPALVDDCAIPPLLRDRVYADFRTSYEHGLNQLTEVLAMEIAPSTVPPKPGEPPPTGSGDDCPSRVRMMSLGNLRRRLVSRLSRSDIGSLWWDVFEEAMDDICHNYAINDCVIQLLDRAKKRQKLDEFYSVLCAERPDVLDA